MTSPLEKLCLEFSKKSPLYIRAKVLPKSPKNEIVEILEDGTYKIRVCAPAEGGKANAELIRFLKKALGASEVVILSGRTERIKLVRISGKSTTEYENTVIDKRQIVL